MQEGDVVIVKNWPGTTQQGGRKVRYDIVRMDDGFAHLRESSAAPMSGLRYIALDNLEYPPTKKRRRRG